MTARQVYEYTLVELNKLKAPSLLLEDFNYFINKSAFNIVALKYYLYDVTQQLSDDLRVLKGTATLTEFVKTDNFDSSYTSILPRDYLHILNCIVEFKPTKDYKCYKTEQPVYFGARRLTSDMFAAIINNYYLKPSFKNPYFYLHDSNDFVLDQNPKTPNVPDKQENSRYGNPSDVKIEIRYGKDDSTFAISKLLIDYLRVPKHIKLTQEELDSYTDTSQVLEFPDYLCYEIIKELVKLLMENNSDARLQTNIPVNKTVPDQPAGNQK